MHKMKAPTITKKDLEEIKRDKERNFQERLEFIKRYAEWLKKTPNKKWSSEQKDIIDL